jgi:hypothetical protein
MTRSPAQPHILAPLQRLGRDRRGSYSVMTALALPVLVGFTGLGTEAGLWFYTHQAMQGAADGAAFSAAVAHSRGSASFRNDATAVAARYGFNDGSGGTLVTVNRPPLSGASIGNTDAVEVIIRQPQQRLFSSVLASGPLAISARAVASATAPRVACILGLDPSAANTLQILNNAVLPDPNCGAASNSTAANGFVVSNNAVAHAAVSSSGGLVTDINSQLLGSPNLTYAPPIPDPYASADAGTPPACTTQNGTGTNNGTRTLRPDVYVGGVGMAHFCGGLNFNNNFQVTLEPGVYFIDTQLQIRNNAILNGTGVTLVINGNYAINLGNNAIINLAAPTSGPTSGLIFFGSRTGTPTVTQTFSNNTVFNLTGAVYFPNQIVNFENNGTTAPTGGCTQVIGRVVRVSNNVSLRANCEGAGTTAMNFAGAAALLE